ncbi:hypothetical protein yfred0001_19580 [Yersinia frederiksenii ATCC 33641]|nr:hypothetical protein yfred0001_19580 [Yersinia frederiksenii ATCC 33641]
MRILIALKLLERSTAINISTAIPTKLISMSIILLMIYI